MVKKITLKESQAPYAVALDVTLLATETMILEKDGEAIAALVPIAEYKTFQTWREAEQRRQARQAEEAAIEREHLAF